MVPQDTVRLSFLYVSFLLGSEEPEVLKHPLISRSAGFSNVDGLLGVLGT